MGTRLILGQDHMDTVGSEQGEQDDGHNCLELEQNRVSDDGVDGESQQGRTRARARAVRHFGKHWYSFPSRRVKYLMSSSASPSTGTLTTNQARLLMVGAGTIQALYSIFNYYCMHACMLYVLNIIWWY